MNLKRKRFIKTFLLIGLVVFLGFGYFAYSIAYQSNVRLEKERAIYIKTGTGFSDLVHQLMQDDLLVREADFRLMAKVMRVANVKAGKYLIKPKMGNRALLTMFRGGLQEPVMLTFSTGRSVATLSGLMAQQLEIDSAAMVALLTNKAFLDSIGFNEFTVLGLFIPDSYQMYWNTDERKLISKLLKAYQKFWNRERIAKAKALNLSPAEISTLASIVQSESNQADEQPIIAGVYLNRLQSGIKLQADPTLVYAAGDFSMKRVLNIHKEIDSPFNTYKYAGLPPGPITLPQKQSIDAVLNYTHHDYLYFCARDDFSGYHTFASTYESHLLNARRFQAALDRRGIKN
ncbi:MAG: hypothetical protein RIQ89_2115 [Bacteroidota bacterium]|jgi:UPF0755 protein